MKPLINKLVIFKIPKHLFKFNYWFTNKSISPESKTSFFIQTWQLFWQESFYFCRSRSCFLTVSILLRVHRVHALHRLSYFWFQRIKKSKQPPRKIRSWIKPYKGVTRECKGAVTLSAKMSKKQYFYRVFFFFSVLPTLKKIYIKKVKKRKANIFKDILFGGGKKIFYFIENLEIQEITKLLPKILELLRNT